MLIPFLLHIIFYDLWFYISHLLLHTKLLWRFHKEHHTVIHPRFLDTYKGHWFESVFQGLGYFAPIAFVPLDASAAVWAFVFVNVRGMARHDDRTVWLIGNHHLLHHQFFHYNYGEQWLDRLFGTLKIETVPSTPEGVTPT